MVHEILASENVRIRRSVVDEFTAELDLESRAIQVWWQREAGKRVRVGVGTWEPLPRPLGDLRGRIIGHGMDRRTRALFEYRLARGDRSWSYTHGPWVTARQMAMLAGVEDTDAESLRKVMWLFYRNRWPLEFSEGCGWGEDSYAAMISAVLSEPQRMRARWDMLILTGGLRWPVEDGDLQDVAGEPILDDFYATP